MGFKMKIWFGKLGSNEHFTRGCGRDTLIYPWFIGVYKPTNMLVAPFRQLGCIRIETSF